MKKVGADKGREKQTVALPAGVCSQTPEVKVKVEN